MPIHQPGSGVVVPPDLPNPAAPIVGTASVYQNTNTRKKIVPRIEGNTWTCTYYGRVIGSMDPATLPSDISDPSLFQFQKVKGMELRVTSELEQNTDEETQTTTVTGTANMYPVVIPIVGDCFIAPLGDGSYGKFGITSTERKSMYGESAFTVNYTLLEYVTELIVSALDDQSIVTLVFDLQGLNEAGGALMTISEYDRRVLRQKISKDLISRMFEEFYSTTKRTFLIPTDEKGISFYDPYLVEFWNRVIDTSIVPFTPIPFSMDTRNARVMTGYTTIWEAILHQERRMLDRAVQAFQKIRTTEFMLSFKRFSIHTYGFDYILQPYKDLDGNIILGDTDGNDPYIFTTNFYTNSPTGQTPLELLIQDAIDKVILEFNDIKEIYDVIDTVTPLERFYQIPLLLVCLTLSR